MSNSLIELAARRLEQLREAGVEVPTPLPSTAQAAIPPRSGGAVEVPSQSRRVELDIERLTLAGFATPNAHRSKIADQFRVIKRPLITNAMRTAAVAGPNPNLIMVTSALPGEGKTFAAINLALSLATELDHTVMLVDADVIQPSVMKVLGLPAGLGLLDLVQDESLDLSHTLLRTNIENLTLLPSGTPHRRATELLASDAMARLLSQIARRYPDRIVVFDSPPLLLATESRVLAAHMGQIVVVVRAEETRQTDVMQALATIDACPVKLMLLNQARAERNANYGYGYAGDVGLERANGQVAV
ncbi:MAG: XrtA-associated tyrosine autokinase [Pseudomonadota bacterium]